MKVKTISSESTENFDKRINDFIKDKVVVDIKYSAVAQPASCTIHTALIIYDEINYHKQAVMAAEKVSEYSL